MVSAQPHFLLFSGTDKVCSSVRGWRFQLESMDGSVIMEASDDEPGVNGERLELLAVVRGLEALDQPSRVTLITSSRHVAQGFRYGLEEWRQHGWRWERDGRWVPVKNQDLWQRVDRALKFHRVECRTWRFDAAHLAVHSVRGTASDPRELEQQEGHGTPVGGRASSVGDASVRRAARPIWHHVAGCLAAASQTLLAWSARSDAWTSSTQITT